MYFNNLIWTYMDQVLKHLIMYLDNQVANGYTSYTSCIHMSINKKSPTDMVISNFAKKSGGDKYTPPLHICNIYNVILTNKKRYYTNPYILSIIMSTKSVSLQ